MKSIYILIFATLLAGCSSISKEEQSASSLYSSSPILARVHESTNEERLNDIVTLLPLADLELVIPDACSSTVHSPNELVMYIVTEGLLDESLPDIYSEIKSVRRSAPSAHSIHALALGGQVTITCSMWEAMQTMFALKEDFDRRFNGFDLNVLEAMAKYDFHHVARVGSYVQIAEVKGFAITDAGGMIFYRQNVLNRRANISTDRHEQRAYIRKPNDLMTRHLSISCSPTNDMDGGEERWGANGTRLERTRRAQPYRGEFFRDMSSKEGNLQYGQLMACHIPAFIVDMYKNR